ncbi:hypothetical protein G4B88_002341 (mitochondrion) [Cannabis sativa]|uniref:Uncharacterized protein n=1 Tax=Cannabis sativa TaxID=3483 RepID=A0A7J6DWU4_CANSA|nr:hypothetical protein G4B88_002341 [Cannabis sativa]
MACASRKPTWLEKGAQTENHSESLFPVIESPMRPSLLSLKTFLRLTKAYRISSTAYVLRLGLAALRTLPLLLSPQPRNKAIYLLYDHRLKLEDPPEIVLSLTYLDFSGSTNPRRDKSASDQASNFRSSHIRSSGFAPTRRLFLDISFRFSRTPILNPTYSLSKGRSKVPPFRNPSFDFRQGYRKKRKIPTVRFRRADEKEERKDGLIPLRRAIATIKIVAIITDRVDLRKKRRNSRGQLLLDLARSGALRLHSSLLLLSTMAESDINNHLPRVRRVRSERTQIQLSGGASGLDIRHENRPMHSLTSVDCGAPYTKLVSERMSGVERKSSTEDLVKQLRVDSFHRDFVLDRDFFDTGDIDIKEAFHFLQDKVEPELLNQKHLGDCFRREEDSVVDR